MQENLTLTFHSRDGWSRGAIPSKMQSWKDSTTTAIGINSVEELDNGNVIVYGEIYRCPHYIEADKKFRQSNYIEAKFKAEFTQFNYTHLQKLAIAIDNSRKEKINIYHMNREKQDVNFPVNVDIKGIKQVFDFYNQISVKDFEEMFKNQMTYSMFGLTRRHQVYFHKK